jgi:tetratricopeptide (TPR) repeat protein
MPGNVIYLRPRGGGPDPAELVRATRGGMSREAFAATLSLLLGWPAKPGMIRAWESGVPVPQDVLEACRADVFRAGAPADVALPVIRAESVGAYPADDAIVIPCRALDGRVIWVSLPRRMFLTGGLGAAALTAVAAAASPGPASAAVARLASASAAADMTPIEHLRRLRRVLVDSDNLLGSSSVIPAVRSQIEVIHQLRASRDGADRRALLVLQAQYAELAGWLHQDARDFGSARFWLDRALEWSQMAADREFSTYVMARKSQLAGDMNEAADAVDLAAAAGRMARKGSRLQATAATYGAHGHALAGQHTACLRVIDGAREMADNADCVPSSPWASWLDDSYIEVQRARCLSALGDHAKAAGIFRQAIRGLPESFRRDRGVYLAREALAHARARDPEQAAEVGMQAVAIANDAQSGRVISELAEVGAGLAPWAKLPAVATFRDALASVIPAERTG